MPHGRLEKAVVCFGAALRRLSLRCRCAVNVDPNGADSPSSRGRTWARRSSSCCRSYKPHRADVDSLLESQPLRLGSVRIRVGAICYSTFGQKACRCHISVRPSSARHRCEWTHPPIHATSGTTLKLACRVSLACTASPMPHAGGIVPIT